MLSGIFYLFFYFSYLYFFGGRLETISFFPSSFIFNIIIMTNLDSILKSRDITLPTKVHLVKAMIFPVVMYGYESWTIKKVEWRIDASEL